ncbi:MAG: GSCFA domain-containing protein [Pricia sp.]
MKLQTQIPLDQAANQIGYDNQLLLLGSCFVENMGKKLEYFKFRQLRNPFGILFHPLAIEQLVSGAVREEFYSESDIFQHDGLWHCFDAHSELSDPSSENLLASLNDGLKATRKQISKASHIIITLGTAWVYKHLDSGGIVANCHKVPQKEFSKELLPIAEIAASLRRSIQLMQSVNPNVLIIFTLSPVHHLKDGFIQNQRSKAHLISAVHQVMQDLGTSSDRAADQTNSELTEPKTNGLPVYFPSYEIIMDELRDYRFYERDMLHPNQLAIDYIWEKFRHVWISKDAQPTMEKVEEIRKGLRHLPFHPESEQHLTFRKSLETKIFNLKAQYPFMDF